MIINSRFKYIFFLFMAVFVIACANESSNKPVTEETIVPSAKSDKGSIVRHVIRDDGTIDSAHLAIISFTEEIYDFGTVEEGEIVEHTFHFSNTGQAPLEITHARSTCGCTIPEWPRDPIAPGEKSKIVVSFDTDMRPGDQIKPITIISNTIPNEHEIQIKGFVNEKE